MELKNFNLNLIGLFGIFLITQVLEIKTTTVDSSLTTLESRIINGEEVSWEGTRYQVSVRLEQLDRNDFGAGHFCGGSIIARNIILTAAHCVWNENTEAFRKPSEYSIVMGNLDRSLNNNNTLKLGVNRIITGLNFNITTFKADVAIMFLNQSIPEDFSRVSVIELNEDQNLRDGTKCVVTGWGLTENSTAARNLMYVEAPIIKRSTCSLNYGSDILDGMLCAGYMQGVRDACSGDSGGPLVCDNKLVGIVSFGLDCAKPGYPGVYTDVAYYVDWVRNQTGLTKIYNSTITNNTNTDNASSNLTFSCFITVFLALLTQFNYS